MQLQAVEVVGGGSLADDHVPYANGDDILVINDTTKADQTVQLTIDFDVPQPGDCPLDLGQPQFNLTSSYHAEGLFFAPWVRVNNTSESVKPADPRLLSVPANWNWPGESTGIWLVYPKVSAPSSSAPQDGPIFTPLWWLP